jgi:miniconductance mechanosensitive channel
MQVTNEIPESGAMQELSIKVRDLLLDWGLSDALSIWLHLLIGIILIGTVALIVDLITKRVIISIITRIVKKSKNDYDDIILEKGVFTQLAHIAPALVIHYMLPSILISFPNAVGFLQNLVNIYMILIGITVIIRFLNAINEIYKKREVSSQIPIKGYIQVVQGLMIIVALVWVLSVLFDFQLRGFFAGLGAFAAVLILVFKDTILGIVASVQISANKMMSIGDWISMPSRKADGTVMDITVTNVKVQNWDKTTASIPTYAFISESFDNWKGMEDSGGRRIKRSINIDMESVKFCTPAMLEKYEKLQMINEYVKSKQVEIEEYNHNLQVDLSQPVNGRRMTNLGTFRKYLESYLHNHPKIHNDMTFLVRQLQPTDKGIPVEIYVFSTDQAWANYESIQADIFDHILAILPEFDLRVFQNPTGRDFSRLHV